MTTPEQVLNWARAQIGTMESPPMSNRVPYWDQIGMHNFQGQPWCGAFVTAAFRQAGLGDIRFVYCPAGRLWFQSQHRLFDEPQVGDVAFYEFEHDTLVDHTGIIEAVEGDHIVAIEGNTVGDGMSGKQADGGGVYRRIRKLSICAGFGRPAYTVAPSHTSSAKSSKESPNMMAYDPISGGNWTVDETGAVFANDGAPYLDGLNAHPDWSTTEANGHVSGIAFWKGDGSDQHGNGYVIGFRFNGSAQPSLYHFDRARTGKS